MPHARGIRPPNTRTPRPKCTPAAATALRRSSGLLSVRTELLEICDQVFDIGIVRQPGKHHLGARDLRPRVLQIFLQGCLVPRQPRVLVGRGVIIAFDRPSRTADDAVEDRTDAVLGSLADLVADLALHENLLAGGSILRKGRSAEGEEGEERQT